MRPDLAQARGRFPASRREFLKQVTTAAAAVPWAIHSTRAADVSEPPRAQIENEFLAVAFEAGAGRWQCRRKDGSRFLTGALAHATLPGGRRATREPAYRHAFCLIDSPTSLRLQHELSPDRTWLA